MQSLSGHKREVYTVCFHPNGQILASGGYDRAPRLWHVASGQCLQVLPEHAHTVHVARFSLNGQTLVTGGGAQRTICIWDVEAASKKNNLDTDIATNEVINPFRLRQKLHGHTETIRSISISPDGLTLASGSEDQTVRLWDLNSGKLLQVLQGHTNRINAVCFSPDGGTLVSGGDDQTIRLWDVPAKQLGNAKSLSPLVTAASGGSDPYSYPLQTLQGYDARIKAACFSPNGQLLASGSVDQALLLWNMDKCTAPSQPLQALHGHTDQVSAICFSPDGQILASGSDDETICLWDMADVGTSGSGQLHQTLRDHRDRIRTVCFSPDRRTLVSGADDKNVYVWDVSNG